jgi:hypothetical protein
MYGLMGKAILITIVLNVTKEKWRLSQEYILGRPNLLPVSKLWLRIKAKKKARKLYKIT